MKAKAKEVPHEFVPVELSMTLHTYQELLALNEFLKMSNIVSQKARESIEGGIVSIPFFEGFVRDVMDECHSQIKHYVNQYNPPGAKKND